jgi:predicted small integral membrane protein
MSLRFRRNSGYFQMTLGFWKKTGTFLVALNVLLLVAAWIMALWSYPRIPATMAARLGVFGWEFGSRTKSPLFFLCPIIQTLLNLMAIAAGRVAASRSRNARLGALRQEHIDMEMIFVNAALIHLQKNIISLAYLGRPSLNTIYLVTLAVILFLICFYYRIRIRSGEGQSSPS